MRVYTGIPEGTQRRAGLLVAQHGPGVDGFIQDAVNRLFRQGYVAAAPELFHRQPAEIKEGTTRVGLLKDDEMFERTKDIHCPVIGFFGADDTNPSPDDVKKIAAELTRLAKPHEFHTYNGAGHACQNFLDASRYRERPARGTWSEMLAFFAQHLKA